MSEGRLIQVRGGNSAAVQSTAEGIAYAHRRGTRIFVAINTYPQVSAFERWQQSVDRAARLGVDALILAVPHSPYMNLDPERIVKASGKPIAVIDCFCILSDDDIRRYFELGCEVKGLGRGHIQRLKEEVRSKK